MRRIVIAALMMLSAACTMAQDTTAIVTSPPAEARSNDHFLIQVGHTSWSGKPDSIKTGGFSRTFNMYLMLDFPFKTNPHWSVALGPGIATDNIFFDKMYVGIKENAASVPFTNLSDTNHFRKYKLATAYLELPVELRYRFNPDNDRRSMKFAIGAKIGTLVNAHVKGKELQDRNDNAIQDYTLKESSKKFFNRTRLSVMGRIGFGHFSAFVSYAITPVFKEGQGPQVRPLTIGLTLGGL